jgi:hypothetical protein
MIQPLLNPTICILCHGHADLVGLYVDSSFSETILYGMCKPCLQLPDSTLRAEVELGVA